MGMNMADVANLEPMPFIPSLDQQKLASLTRFPSPAPASPCAVPRAGDRTGHPLAMAQGAAPATTTTGREHLDG